MHTAFTCHRILRASSGRYTSASFPPYFFMLTTIPLIYSSHLNTCYRPGHRLKISIDFRKQQQQRRQKPINKWVHFKNDRTFAVFCCILLTYACHLWIATSFKCVCIFWFQEICVRFFFSWSHYCLCFFLLSFCYSKNIVRLVGWFAENDLWSIIIIFIWIP